MRYSICATNMHLLPQHGMSVKEIEADGFEIEDYIYMSLDGYDHFTMTKSLGVFINHLLIRYVGFVQIGLLLRVIEENSLWSLDGWCIYIYAG